MSDVTALPPALQRVAAYDPGLAEELDRSIARLSRAAEALVWAEERLPELLAAPSTAARLEVLVAAARELTDVPEAWAATWTGQLDGGQVSISAVAGDGSKVPGPDELSQTILAEVVAAGRPTWSDDALADARFAAAQSVQAYGLRSVGCLPIGAQGALYLMDPDLPGRFDPVSRARLGALARLVSRFQDSPTRPPEPVAALPGLIGDTPQMQELARTVRAFAPLPWPALVLGETGTGKEVVARTLHELSPIGDGPFVPVNCGAIPAELAESTLFGHERGSFTGADRRREGLVSRATGGTLFLDEVGELPAPLQVKLLRLLQEGTYERVGGDRVQRFQGRIVAATHRPLDTDRGGFRDDLYYRLAACVIRTPPLRERRQDIPTLAAHLLARDLAAWPQLSQDLTLDPSCEGWLIGQDWPGNVRELENAIRGALGRAVADKADRIRPEHLQEGGRSAAGGPAGETWDLQAATDAFQKDMVSRALAACDDNRTRAAERLGVSRPWLYKLLARWEDVG